MEFGTAEPDTITANAGEIDGIDGRHAILRGRGLRWAKLRAALWRSASSGSLRDCTLSANGHLRVGKRPQRRAATRLRSEGRRKPNRIATALLCRYGADSRRQAFTYRRSRSMSFCSIDASLRRSMLSFRSANFTFRATGFAAPSAD